MRAETASIGKIITWLYGPIIWATHFFLLYGAEAFLCTAQASRDGEIRLIALVLTASALLALLGFSAWQFISYRRVREQDRASNVMSFFWMTSIVLAALAMIGVIWVAAGAMLIPACAPPAG